MNCIKKISLCLFILLTGCSTSEESLEEPQSSNSVIISPTPNPKNFILPWSIKESFNKIGAVAEGNNIYAIPGESDTINCYFDIYTKRYYNDNLASERVIYNYSSDEFRSEGCVILFNSSLDKEKYEFNAECEEWGKENKIKELGIFVTEIKKTAIWQLVCYVENVNYNAADEWYEAWRKAIVESMSRSIEYIIPTVPPDFYKDEIAYRCNHIHICSEGKNCPTVLRLNKVKNSIVIGPEGSEGSLGIYEEIANGYYQFKLEDDVSNKYFIIKNDKMFYPVPENLGVDDVINYDDEQYCEIFKFY